MSSFPKRGDVHWVALDPTLGSEIQKTRPAVIISNDVGNELASCVIVAPLSGNVNKVYSFQVKIAVIMENREKVVTNQLRTVDKQRLGKRICTLQASEMQQVDASIKLVLALT